MEQHARDQRLANRVSRYKRRSDRLAWWRFGVFSLGTVALVTAVITPLFRLPVLGAGFGCFAVYFILVRIHGRAERMGRIFSGRLAFEKRLQAVGALAWNALPELPPISSAVLPELSELDVIGERSLLRLINTTWSTQGFDRLVGLFSSNGRSVAEVQRIGRLVQEACSLPVLTHRFIAMTRPEAGEETLDTASLKAFLTKELCKPGAAGPFRIHLVIQLVAVALFGWFYLRGGRPLFLIPAAVALGTHFWAKRRIETAEAFEYAVSVSFYFEKFQRAVALLERYSSTQRAELRLLFSVFRGERSAARQLKALERITGALAIRENPVVHVLAHLIFPWNLYWTGRLETVRGAVAREFPQWIAALAEFEAVVAVASYAEANPSFSWPVLREPGTQPFLKASGLRHPLIPAPRVVSNELVLDERERCILVTGSNMSGKSTWLRSIGTNLLLAKAGAPVAAESFEFVVGDLHAALRVPDSLQEGLSGFYAEVRRLKEILESAEQSRPLLYLVDEIFRGTNNRERMIGSRAYLKALAATPAYGLVTTHDLELAALEQEVPGIVNYHFRETISDGKMAFSYRKERGPCPTTNALQVMRLGGLPVE